MSELDMGEVERSDLNLEQVVNDDYIDVRAVTEGVKAVDMPFDYKRVDRSWEDKYGITSVPLLVRSISGQLYDDRRLKGLFVEGNYKRLVSRTYTVFPNQEVDEIIREIADKARLTIGKTVHQSHFGDAMYWQVLDLENKEFVQAGDGLNAGCIVRNSLGAGVALGADAFTFRLVCENGAIARGKNLGSISLRHVGSHDEMLENFTDNIANVIDQARALVNVYRRAVKIRMNPKIARDFVKYVPERALPDSISITRKKGRISAVTLRRHDSLWETFNSITESAWHHKKTGFITKSGILQNAHRVLFHATSDVAAAAAA